MLIVPAYGPKLSTGSYTGSVDFFLCGQGPKFPFTRTYKKSLKFIYKCRQIYIESVQIGTE